MKPPRADRPRTKAEATRPRPTTSSAAPKKARGPGSQSLAFRRERQPPRTISSAATVIPGTGERGPGGGFGPRTAAGAVASAVPAVGSAGMSSHSRRYTKTPVPPASARATKPTRQSSASMPLYSARPPLTPPSTLSRRLRRSCGADRGAGGRRLAGRPGPGARGTGVGGRRRGCRCHGRSLPTAGPADHQGRPPSDPGSSSGVITGIGRGPAVRRSFSCPPPVRAFASAVAAPAGRAVAGSCVAAGTARTCGRTPWWSAWRSSCWRRRASASWPSSCSG